MNPSRYFEIAELVLRGLYAAPQLVNAWRKFWKEVTSNPGAPPHLEAAMQAAFDRCEANPKTPQQEQSHD